MGAAAPLPEDMRPLTSLRFAAAVWVLAYHFRDHLGLGLGEIGFAAAGWLGVDLFFALSGFILAHVYLQSVEHGRFRYGAFLQNRLARIYPLHLATLGVMLALYAAAGVAGAGVGEPGAFKFADLPAHLLLVHAWGTTESVGWNFPSWSISAEWGAYLVFPLAAGLALKVRHGALLLAGALGLCMASYAALDALHAAPGFEHVGRGYAQMTAQIGLLRIAPSFFMGVALYVFARSCAAPALWAWPIATVSLAWIALVIALQAWLGLVWLGFAGLIYGLAEIARHGRGGWLDARAAVFLGAASYALYMTHLPVDIVYFHALEQLGVDAGAPLIVRAGALLGVFALCIGAACAAYLVIEKPARDWVRGLRPPAFRRAPAPQP